MLKTFFWILAVLMVLFFSSCEKTCYCDSTQLKLQYISFTPPEVDTIEMRRYTKGSKFGSPIDTILITDSAADFSWNGDTVTIQGESERFYFRSTYDYQLYLPALNRKDNIDSIFELQDVVEGNHDLQCNCINRIPLYHLNDSLMRTDETAPKIRIKR